ncbi:MAG: glutamine amidotransferase [Kosmotogaceae bacterium]
MSDLAPHWGIDFVKWEYYGKFWHQAIKWLTE